MSYANLLVAIEDRIATVTVNRPDKLNALNDATIEELGRAIAALSGDAAVGGIIVTGAGRAFVAGADIVELSLKSPEDARRLARRGQEVFARFERCPKPVIAAVNGFALGGGCELALACHVRLASEHAKFGQPEVKLGVIPGYGGTQRLPRLVGRGMALQLLLTGEIIDAAEAHRIGLVNRVVPRESLLETADTLARRMVRNAPLALRHALLAIDQGLEVDLEKGLLLEATLFGILCGTEDLREGMNAFLEKRKAAFRGK